MSRSVKISERRWWSRHAMVAVLVCSLAVLLALPADAQAKRKPRAKRAKPSVEKAVRLQPAPPLEFITGTLSRDGGGCWRLDDHLLCLRPGFGILGAGPRGGAGAPAIGMRVLLVGQTVGGRFQTQSGVVQSAPLPGVPKGQGARTVDWSDENPKVGEGAGPGRS